MAAGFKGHVSHRAARFVARFFQGLGAAAPMNLTRAVIRDGASGDEATRAMSVVSVFQSAGPALSLIHI